MIKPALALAALFTLTACPQPGPTDGGTGGGTGGGATTTGGGGTTTGGGGATGGGGGTTGGGGATGGGSAGPFDAGHLSCTFTAPFVLEEGLANFPTAQVAVTEQGEAIYAWNTPMGVKWVVQSPSGAVGTALNDATGGLLLGSGLVARGDRALLVFGSTTPEVRVRRYRAGSGWAAPESAPPTPTSLSVILAGLEPSGAASIWRQDSNGGAFFEVTSDGTSAFGNVHDIADAGFPYAVARANGTRLAVTLKSFTGVDKPELIVSTSSGDQRIPMQTAVLTGNDYFRVSLADDGTAIVAGAFNTSGIEGVGVMARTGTAAFGAVQMLNGDGGMFMSRTVGTVAGPGGIGAVVWWDDGHLFISRRSGSTFGPAQLLTDTDQVIPRTTQISGSRILVSFYATNGTPSFIEVTADGAGPVTPTSAPYSTEFAAGGTQAASVIGEQDSDGGWILRAAQCR